MIVVLLGYMGSGKSTVGQKLAQRFDYKFLDLDYYIQKKFKTRIHDIFKNKGEIYFRKIEAECVKEICENNIDIVIALGGGTPCYGNTLDYLLSKSSVNTIYLKASLDNLVKRLSPEKNKRPIISNIGDENIKEFIAKHLFERSEFYDKAHYKIDTNSLTLNQIVNRIELLFRVKPL